MTIPNDEILARLLPTIIGSEFAFLNDHPLHL